MGDDIRIGQAIQEMAHSIFCDCGAELDYCVQAVGTRIVFGKYNRLILGRYGWDIDRPYCRDEFIEAWERLYGV